MRRSMHANYSRFVSLMKVGLPAMAAALLGLLATWPKLASHDDAFHLGFSKINLKSVDTLSMTNPRYFGTDNANLPFTVTADVATQVDPQNLMVSLEKPVADFTRRDGTGEVLKSDFGFFRQKDGTLDLMGHVDLYQDSGYEMHTESARIDVGPGDAEGDQPAFGQGPTGTVQGEGFRIKQRGRVIVYTGKAKAILNVSHSKDKEKP